MLKILTNLIPFILATNVGPSMFEVVRGHAPTRAYFPLFATFALICSAFTGQRSQNSRSRDKDLAEGNKQTNKCP